MWPDKTQDGPFSIMFTKTPPSDKLQIYRLFLLNASEDDSLNSFFGLFFLHLDLASLPLSAISCPKVKSHALCPGDSPMKSCSMKLWNSFTKSTTEEFTLRMSEWTFSIWTFWILSMRSPWDITVTLSPLTQLQSPDTCRFRPSLILSRLSDKESKRPHTPSSLESLRSRPSLDRRHSPTSVT